MSKLVLEKLKLAYEDAILETHSDHGDDTAIVKPESWKAIAQYLRSDPQLDFDMPTDLCGVDYPSRTPRMEVVMHLYSTTRKHRIRVKTRIGDEDLDGCEIDSVTSIWPGMNCLER